jgi:hypothetical protein
MKIINMDAYQRLCAERQKLSHLALMHMENGEKRAVSVFDWMVAVSCDEVASKIDLSNVIRIAPELTIGSGRVDRAFFHKNGSLTLVEIKDCASQRQIVAGIGQVLVYSAMAERALSATRIIPVLAVLGEPDGDVKRACDLAGVEYIALGDVRFLRFMSAVTHLILVEQSARMAAA